MYIIEALYAHILVCAFFNRNLLAAPDKEAINHYRDQRLFDEWPIAQVSDQSREGLAVLRSFFQEISDQDFEGTVEDYRELFVGPANIVPVWESVWTTKHRLLFDDPTLKVRDFYARYGLMVAHKGMDPDDHIGFEFAFTGHLLQDISRALKNGNPEKASELESAANVFFRSHLNVWAPKCFGLIAERAKSGFYRGVALLGIGYLEELAVFLKDLEGD